MLLVKYVGLCRLNQLTPPLPPRSACASNPRSYAPYNATATAAAQAGPSAAANGSEGWQVLISLVFTGASLAWTTAGTSDGLDRLAEEASPGALSSSSSSSSSASSSSRRNYAPIRTPLRGEGEDEEAKYDDALMIEEESLETGGGGGGGGGGAATGRGKRASAEIESSSSNRPPLRGDEDEVMRTESRAEEDEMHRPAAGLKTYWRFHVIMAMGAVYMSMILTNWGYSNSSANVQSAREADISASQRGVASMWVKTVSQWLTFTMYTWTLLAPACFPDRDFS